MANQSMILQQDLELLREIRKVAAIVCSIVVLMARIKEDGSLIHHHTCYHALAARAELICTCSFGAKKSVHVALESFPTLSSSIPLLMSDLQKVPLEVACDVIITSYIQVRRPCYNILVRDLGWNSFFKSMKTLH